MKFYINKIHCLSNRDYQVIGLFTNGEWEGEGNFCGWYSAEYYKNTTLLAYYCIKEDDELFLKGPHTKEKVIKTYYPKIEIDSCYCEKILEAKNEDEAIKKFFNEDF